MTPSCLVMHLSGNSTTLRGQSVTAAQSLSQPARGDLCSARMYAGNAHVRDCNFSEYRWTGVTLAGTCQAVDDGLSSAISIFQATCCTGLSRSATGEHRHSATLIDTSATRNPTHKVDVAVDMAQSSSKNFNPTPEQKRKAAQTVLCAPERFINIPTSDLQTAFQGSRAIFVDQLVRCKIGMFPTPRVTRIVLSRTGRLNDSNFNDFSDLCKLFEANSHLDFIAIGRYRHAEPGRLLQAAFDA